MLLKSCISEYPKLWKLSAIDSILLLYFMYVKNVAMQFYRHISEALFSDFITTFFNI